MIRKATYSIPETLARLQSTTEPVIDFDGDMIKTFSKRYQVFAKSTVCCVCGLRASFFAKERFEDQNRYHLNLYGKRNGKEVLFTKDHIIPKSRGGSDSLENLQTMCCVCNEAKGNSMEGDMNING